MIPTNMLKESINANGDEETPLLATSSSRISNRKNKWLEILACLAVYFAPLSAGFAIGYSGCTIAYLQKHVLTDQEASWFASILNIGAALGGLLGGLFADRFGRKITLLLLTVPLAIGFGLMWVPYPYVLIISRFLCGLGVGMTCLCAPTYIAEISSKEMRGMLGTGFQLIITFGVLLSFLIGMFVSYQWLATVAAIATIIGTIVITTIPESPVWLLSCGRHSDALNSLISLRGDISIAESEFTKLSEGNASQNYDVVEFRSIFKASIIKPVSISLVLMMIQQYGGINCVLFFCSEIFEKAGFAKNPNLGTTAVGGVQFITTIFVALLIEKIGRKPLMIASCTGLALSCLSMGIYYYLADNNISDIPGLSLGSLMFYIFFFSIGGGPIPWLMMSELIPQRVKGKASALATFTNWISAFIVTKTRINMVNGIYDYGTFWTYGGVNFVSAIFVALFVPETKGKTLQEIEDLFSESSAREIPSEYTGI